MVKKSKHEVIESLVQKAGKQELRARVDAHCVSCTYDDVAPGTWRQQVERCTVKVCPLFDVRSKSRSTAAKSRFIELDGALVPLEDVTPEMQRFDNISAPKGEDRELDS